MAKAHIFKVNILFFAISDMSLQEPILLGLMKIVLLTLRYGTITHKENKRKASRRGKPLILSVCDSVCVLADKSRGMFGWLCNSICTRVR
jgi:hypothetical protein